MTRPATEESQLQLLHDLIGKLGAARGLANTAGSIARLVCDAVRGSYGLTYYAIGDRFHCTDAHGETREADRIDDGIVREAFEKRQLAQEPHGMEDAKAQSSEPAQTFTWAVPLIRGNVVVAALKVERAVASAREVEERFGTFLSYSALLLNSEVSSHVRLSQACEELDATRTRLTEEAAQREVEAASRQNAVYFRWLIESILDPLVTTDLEGRITDANAAAESASGRSRSQLVGTNFADYFDDPAKARECRGETLRDGFACDCQLGLLHSSGSVMDVSINLTVYRNEAGEAQGILVITRDISEAKRTQAQLARLAAIVTSSHDAMITEDLDGVVTSWNTGAEELWGYRGEEMMGRTLEVLTPEDLKGEHSDLVRLTLQGSRISSFETVRVCKDGRPIDVAVTLSPILDADGRIVAISVMDHDISVRKRAEEALRRGEKDLREAQRLSRIGSWDWDAATDTITWSDEYYSIYGIDRSKSPPGYEEHLSAYTPESARRLDAAVQENLRTGDPYEVDLELANTEGQTRWVTARSETKRDASGNITGLRGTAQDITGRKLAEEALRESEKKLSLHLEQTLLGVIEWDMESRVEEWNPAAESIFGYSRDEALGRRADELIIPETIKSELESRWEALLGNKGGGKLGTNENVTKDGRTILCEWINTPLTIEDGTVIGVMSLVADVTEKRQAEQLRVAKEAAEAATKAKEAFLASISHEIRTPLNAILGFAQLLRSGGGLSERQRQQLDIINSSGAHLLVLINDVLEMSRIEAGMLTANRAALDLHSLLDEMGTVFRPLAQARGLELNVVSSNEVPRYAVTDENKLRQVLTNLLGNSIKFTDRGSIELRVTVERAEGRHLHLLAEVRDTGRGIAPSDVERMFEYFEQSGAMAKEPGTGLGLAISREFVRLLGGDIAVESQLGKGSVFRFNILIEEAESGPAGSVSARRRVVGLRAGEPQYRVLVADDSPDNRELLVQILESAGFCVKSASNGSEAVDEFESWRPQLILMDMRMPVMDGYEATRRIRATDGGADVSIVGVTASAFSEMRQAVLDAGVNQVVVKPLDVSELYDKIRKLLGVDYVYERESAVAETVTPTSLGALAMSALPGDLVSRLQRATASADFDTVLDLVDEVARYDNDSAMALRALARSFDSDGILAALPEGAADPWDAQPREG